MDDQVFMDLLAIWKFFDDMQENKDYIINQKKMNKLKELFEFLTRMAEESNGKLVPVVFEPRDETGDITIKFPMLQMDGDEISRFSEAIRNCDSFEFCAYNDGIHITFVITQVFKHK